MPPTFTIIPGGSDREVVYDPGRSRTSSGGSRSHRSGGSGRRSYSGSAGSESWSEVGPRDYEEEEEIAPSDSASRSRQPASRRESQTRPPPPPRRHSSRRISEPEEEPRRRQSSRRHHSSRHRHGESRRVPSDESSGTVASRDDYPYGHHNNVPPRAVYPPPSGFRHVPAQGHGGYPPSMVSAAPGHPDGYSAQSLVHMPQQDAFGYPVHNAFSPPGSQANPFSPMGNTSATSYFGTDPHAPPMPHHHRPPLQPRPQSFVAPSSHYGGSEMMSPYGHPGMPAYPGYPMHMPGYHHMGGWPYPPPSQATSPPPQTPQPAQPAQPAQENKEIEGLKALLQKHEEARVAREKEYVARVEADAAAQAARLAREEEEKKKKEEIAAASKKAKEDAEQKAADAAKKAKEEHEKKLKEAKDATDEAEKKAKEEHEKKLKEAKDAKDEAEKKQKELEEEKKKLTPAPDLGKAPIKFKDAVGRKFSFPFHLCKTWKGMEGLIKQAFLHVDVIGEHVHQGHYDLTGPDGEIILPQVWDTMIQPDWEVSMHMWPIPEEEKEKKKEKIADDLANPFASLGLGDLGDLGIVDPGKKKPRKSDSKKKKSDHANIITIPPPPSFPPGNLPDPLGGVGLFPDEIVHVKKEKSSSSSRPKAKSKSSKDPPSLASWFAGSSGSKSSKKGDEKLDAHVRRKSASSSSHSSRADQVSCAVM